MMGLRRIDSNGIDNAIHSDATREAFQSFNRIFAIEVDDLGALVLRHFQTRRNRVDGEDAASIQKLCARNHELANRSAAENCNRAAGMDTCDLCGHPCSGDDVGDKNCVIVGHSIWNSNHTDVREGDARIFSLQAVEGLTEASAAEELCSWFGTGRICFVTLGVVSGPTRRAVSPWDGGRAYNSIPGNEIANATSSFINDAHAPLSQKGSRNPPCHSAA